MAGPGGGGRGGGGGRSRGGSRGGFRGSRGGSHRGYHGGHIGGTFRYTYHPGQGWRRNEGGGGGCFLRLFIPIYILVFLLIELYRAFFGYNVAGSYNENTYQDYVNAQYNEVFGSSDAYEDNLMLSVLVDDDYYSYYYIAWVGDHVVTDINYMLGAEGTALGDAMEMSINPSSYKYSLDSNLAQVMEYLTDEVEALGLESSFSCSENRGNAQARLINDSNLELTESTILTALNGFVDSTGIPTVIVVEDMDDVFRSHRTTSALDTSEILILVVGAVILIATLVFSLRELLGMKKQKEEHPYHAFDDQY